MEISDIQRTDKKSIGFTKVEITFCDEETYEDVMTLKLSKDAIWQIVKWAQHNISYATELCENPNHNINRKFSRVK